MGAFDVITLAMAKAFTKKTVVGLGAIKGAPCTVKSIEDIAGGHRVTFEWEDKNGQKQTSVMDVMNGAKGDDGAAGAQGEKGDTGEAGVSPTVTITTIEGGHRVTITDKDHPSGQSFDVMDGKGSGTVDWENIQNKPDNLATKDDIAAKIFVAEYNKTTAQEINAFLDSADPKAPMVVKRGADYYTVITTSKQADNKVIIRTFATLSGVYYIFQYTVTNAAWTNGNYGLQQVLQSGTNIKTINGQSVLGSGDLSV